jgi:hypothetical protein
VHFARLPDANPWPAPPEPIPPTPPVPPLGPLQPPTHVPPFEPLEPLADSTSIQSFAPVQSTHPTVTHVPRKSRDWTLSRRLKLWIWSLAPWRRQSSPR